MSSNQITLPVGFILRGPQGERYTVERLLGKGGFGAVYLVQEKARGLRFALKEVIHPTYQEWNHFLFEWEVLKKVKHDALPRVYQIFKYEKLRRVYILMQYIEGHNLEVLRGEQPERRFTLPHAMTMMNPIAAAISYLHAQEPPIIHRDVKPANIIVPADADKAVLVDLGLAKVYVPDGTTTTIRQGTPAYAAPEQYGTGTNPRTDLYGLGATMYTLLTGVVPHDVLKRLAGGKGNEPLKPAHQLVPTIPTTVSEAINRAMHLNSEERFASVDEFWQTIQQGAMEKKASSLEVSLINTTKQPVVQSAPSIADTSIFGPTIKLKSPRKRVLTALLLMLLLFVLGGGGLFSYAQAYSIFSSSKASHTPISLRSTTPTAPAADMGDTTEPESPYPALTTNYTGTIDDMTAGTETDLALIKIQQNQQHISGLFLGLGLAGSFNGTITRSGHMQFTVKIYGGNTTLAFDGNVRSGGIIAGSYKVINRSGQATGELGTWTAKPGPPQR